MVKMIAAIQARYMSQEEGATAIEYGLIAAGIALAISAAVLLLGDKLTAMFTEIAGKL